MVVCHKCKRDPAGSPKRIPTSYAQAHLAWHKRGKRVRRVHKRDAATSENLRLSRARRKTNAR